MCSNEDDHGGDDGEENKTKWKGAVALTRINIMQSLLYQFSQIVLRNRCDLFICWVFAHFYVFGSVTFGIAPVLHIY